jgi:hypothetical protein
VCTNGFPIRIFIYGNKLVRKKTVERKKRFCALTHIKYSAGGKEEVSDHNKTAVWCSLTGFFLYIHIIILFVLPFSLLGE